MFIVTQQIQENFESDLNKIFQWIFNNIIQTQQILEQNFCEVFLPNWNPWGKNINTFHLVDNEVSFDDELTKSREFNNELAIIIPDEYLLTSIALNHQ